MLVDHGGSHTCPDQSKREPCPRLHLSRSVLPSISLTDVGLSDLVEVVPRLREALVAGADPRARRGVRHPLAVVLTAAVCAVAAGAQSYVAIAEWVADLPAPVAAALGLAETVPVRIDDPPGRAAARRRPVRRGDQRLDPAATPRRTVHQPVGDGRSRWTGRPCAGRDRRRQPAAAARGDRPDRVVLGQINVNGSTSRARPARSPCSPRCSSASTCRGRGHRGRAAHPARPRRLPAPARLALGVHGEAQPTEATSPARRAALAGATGRPPRRRDPARAPGDPLDQGRQRRRRESPFRTPPGRSGSGDGPGRRPGAGAGTPRHGRVTEESSETSEMTVSS